MIFENILIYHLDHEIHELFDINQIYSRNEIKKVFTLALRLAYLLAKDNLIIPASNYFESTIANEIINQLRPLNEFGIIQLSTKSFSLESLLKKKKIEHDLFFLSDGYLYSDYENLNRSDLLYLPFTLTKKKLSSSQYIQNGWTNSIGETSIWSDLYKLYPRGTKVDFFDSELASIPDRLEKRAYISRYIVPFLSVEEENKVYADKLINEFITKQYIKSYLCEYNAYCLSGIPFIDDSRILPDDMIDYYISYSKYVSLLATIMWEGVSAIKFVENCNVMDLVVFKNSRTWHEALNIDENTNLQFKVSKDSPIILDGKTFLGGNNVMTKSISVFVTYSCKSEEHQKKVVCFVNKLRENGFDAIQDLDIINQYANFTDIMNYGLQRDKVIVVLSPDYKLKADNVDEKTGVRFEATKIADDMQSNPSKYIFVSFDAIDSNSIENMTPVLFKGCQIIDLTSKNIQNGYNMLFSRLEDDPVTNRPAVANIQPGIAKF